MHTRHCRISAYRVDVGPSHLQQPPQRRVVLAQPLVAGHLRGGTNAIQLCIILQVDFLRRLLVGSLARSSSSSIDQKQGRAILQALLSFDSSH
jgi:hypothetical protein